MSKKIQGSVGVGGRNLRPDVVTVQYLLNCVPAGKGGPFPELAVDGLVGPKTVAAIRKYQTTAFGHADGRVDAGGKTLTALLVYDPYPLQPVVPQASSQGAAGSSGKDVAGQKGGAGAPWGKQGADPWWKSPPGKGGAGGKTGF
jgi:peptidoglycan hydrolase-like protein with peptidoglycan-binding domain